jgi:hypothetical protein
MEHKGIMKIDNTIKNYEKTNYLFQIPWTLRAVSILGSSYLLPPYNHLAHTYTTANALYSNNKNNKYRERRMTIVSQP